MVRPDHRWLPLMVLASGAAGCLLYTDPINVPPEIDLAAPPLPLHRGVKAVFSATARDQDENAGSLTISWHRGADCAQASASAAADSVKGSSSQYSLRPEVLGPGCIVARATDSRGASRQAELEYAVVNRAPEAVITGPQPQAGTTTYPLYAHIELSAAKSVDPDPGETEKLSFGWTVTGPNGQSLPASTCPEAKTPAVCAFTPDQPGSYLVKVTAADGSGATSPPASLDLTVEADRPPCIVGYTPTTLQPVNFADESSKFTVTLVDDDGDGYPPDTDKGTFLWWYRRGTTGTWSRLSPVYDSPEVEFGRGFFSTGQIAQVRVEYQDRISRSLQSCAANAERCELRPGCAQWLTWTISFL